MNATVYCGKRVRTLVATLTGLLLFPVWLRAHDPYEITSLVYIQSNRIEVILEMEFATGMRLAGLQPSQQDSAESQFAAAVPQLEQFAGGLFEITAGNNVVLPVRTNVELGVEAHIRGRLELALTDYRPLRFAPRGLRAVPDTPYGVSLTVLDLVNKKVLGQAALFADSPPADFPATASGQSPVSGPVLAVAKAEKPPLVVTNEGKQLSPLDAKTGQPRPPRTWATVSLLAVIVLLVVAWRWSQSRS